MARTTPGGRFGKRTKATKPVESSAEHRDAVEQEDAVASPSRECAGDASGTDAADDPFVVGTPTKKRTRQENGDGEEDDADEKEVVAALLPRASPTKRQSRSAPAAERDPAFVTPTKPRSTRTGRRSGTTAGVATSPPVSSPAGTPSSATRRAAREADSHALPTPPVTPTISISPSPCLASVSASAVRNIDIDEDDDALLPPTPTSASGRRDSLASTSSLSAAETPISPTAHSGTNVYARARALLRLSADVAAASASSAEMPVHGISSDDLVGRNIEKEQLLDFLNVNLPSLCQQKAGACNETGNEYTASGDDSADGDRDGPSPSAARAHRAKAMYISGSPGTGKTALLSHVLERLQAQQADQLLACSAMGKGKAALGTAVQTRTAFLNCASIAVGKKEEIWMRLADALGFDMAPTKGKTEYAGQQAFERQLQKSGNPRCLVVLDEIDHLLTTASTNTSQINVLSRLFGLALDPKSNLVLIGIANALDLTSRHLQLEVLSAGTNLGGPSDMGTDDETEETTATSRQPELLHFRPFQAEEMVAIAKARLSSLHAPTPSSPDNATLAPTPSDQRTSIAPVPLPIFMPAALDFAAKKVAAVTGDLRSFLSLIRKAVELFEAEQRKRLSNSDLPTVVPSAANNGSPASSSMSRRNSQPGRDRAQADCLAHFTASTAPKLTPAHILKATRLVTLSPAASSSASSAGGSASSGSALSTASNSALLEAKIADLNLQQRLALTAFVICIWQRQAAAALPSWALAAVSSPTATVGTGEGVKPADLHSGYRALLEKEDMIHPVGSNEFSDLLSGLHTRGLVGLEREVASGVASGSSGMGSLSAPPMLRRTSSSSSAGGGGSSRSPRGSRSPSPSAAHAPLALLYAPAELAQALRSTRPTEAAGMCTRILAKEERRLRRWRTNLERAQVERDEKRLAPSEGFAGDGLEGVSGLVGSRDRRGAGRDADMDELEQEGENSTAREDHERLLLGEAASAGRDA